MKNIIYDIMELPGCVRGIDDTETCGKLDLICSSCPMERVFCDAYDFEIKFTSTDFFIKF